MKTVKKGRFLKALLFVAVTIAVIAFAACGWDEEDYEGSFFDPGRGDLMFLADGEEFIRDGFVSVDDWHIEFDHVYVYLTDIYAEQTSGISSAKPRAPASSKPSPAGDMDRSYHAGHGSTDTTDGGTSFRVPLKGSYFVDLHDQAGPTTLGIVTGVVAGNYDSVDFTVTPAADSTAQLKGGAAQAALDSAVAGGYSMVWEGVATDLAPTSVTYYFRLELDEELPYVDCGPNDPAGFVSNGGIGEAHLTFHSDHIFGDAADDWGEGVNTVALGFGPIADLGVCASGTINDHNCDLTQTELQNNMPQRDYNTFINALLTIGHSGEGHCHLAE